MQAGDYTLAEPTTTANITPATLTVSGITAANKVYDGTTNATLNTAGAILVGVYNGDTVTLNTSGAEGTFASPSVANGVTVTISGLAINGAVRRLHADSAGHDCEYYCGGHYQPNDFYAGRCHSGPILQRQLLGPKCLAGKHRQDNLQRSDSDSV